MTADNESQKDLRTRRLKQEDQELFRGKKMHRVQAAVSFGRINTRNSGSQILKGKRKLPDGKEEAIGIVFHGQRVEDLQEGALAREMLKQRISDEENGKLLPPEKDLELTGAWKPRTWKDSQGNQHKAFDLVVASWTYTNSAGERVTEGAEPSAQITASRAPDHATSREAAVKAKAQQRAQSRKPRPQRNTKQDQNPFEL
jgi:hypothetical protein